MLSNDVWCCLDCGKCSGGCPISRVTSFLPRAVVRDYALFGDHEDVFSNYWYCTLCELCKVRCPAAVDYPKFILSQRSKIYAKYRDSLWPQPLQKINSYLQGEGNIYDMPAEDRTAWTYDVEDLIEGRMNKEAEVAYFVGCVSSFTGRLAGIPTSFTKILCRLGVDFTVLGTGEWCCGSPLLLGGAKERMLELARHNVSKLSGLDIKTLVASCPACSRVLRFEYPRILGEDLSFRVLHASEFLAEQVDKGILKLGNNIRSVVTYHDPCELGRLQGVFEAPRKVLEHLAGKNFVETSLNREQTRCCGGGGLLKMMHPEVSLEIAKLKLKEFDDLGADMLISGCPACKLNFIDAVRETRSDLKIMDITEFVGMVMEQKV